MHLPRKGACDLSTRQSPSEAQQTLLFDPRELGRPRHGSGTGLGRLLERCYAAFEKKIVAETNIKAVTGLWVETLKENQSYADFLISNVKLITDSLKDLD